MFTKHPSQFLAKTDPRDPAQVKTAVENLKKWARAKLKKGTLREVAGRGGKIEQLEIEFAHRGYQDIFYLTRFELSLPPSRLNLPQPSPAVGKTLADANFPLRNLQQSTPSQTTRKSTEARREVFVEEDKPRPSTSSEKSKRMTMGVKEITWGKPEAVPTVPPVAQPGPSSPPSPILYVPPRPPPPATASLDSPINMTTPDRAAPAPQQYGAGVASTRLPGAGVASTSAPRAMPAAPAPEPIPSLLDPSSAIKTPTKLPSPGLLTPSTVNDPMPITPTSARTSSLGWPNGAANFRISQYQPALQPITPTPNGPRRGSEGPPHLPHELQVQQPQHRRPSAPFLAAVPDPSAYHEESKEVLDDEPPKLPELSSIPLSAKSEGKGKQPAHKSQMSDPFVVKPEEKQNDAAAAKEAEMKRLLEDKIRALQTELETLEAAKAAKPVEETATAAPKTEARSPPRTAPAPHSGHKRQPSSDGGIPPTIPLPPLPAPISTENRKPKPPPLTLQHTNMSSSRPKPPSRSNSALTPDEPTSKVKIPSPLRASTVPDPSKTAPAGASAPSRPQRPPSAMIPQSMRNMNGQTTQEPSGDYFSSQQPLSQSSSLAPSPTIITKASLESVSVAQAQTHTVSVPTSAPMTRTPKSPPRGNRHDQPGGLVAPKESKNGAPRLSILEPSPTFLADNWLSDLDSNLSSFDLDEPSPALSVPSFPPPPGRKEIQPPRSAPPTQTKMKISNPVPIDLDTDPRLVGKSRSALGSKSANSTPVIGFGPTPNSYGAQGMPKSLQSFPPRAGPKHSPKSRSNSLPGDDDIPQPYGRSPNLNAVYDVPKTSTALQVQHALAQSSRQPVNAALAASPSSRLPMPTRRAPVPQTEPLKVSLQSGRAPIPTYSEPQKTMDADVASRRVQGYRQSISARYANKLQPQPQKPTVKVQPQIVRADYTEEDEGEGWVGFAV